MTATAGTRTLFFDMAEFTDLYNVVQRVMEATKHPGNPILPLGDVDEWDSCQARPWETRTIIYDEEEGLFKCWYSGTDLSTERWWGAGYATSDDGIHWEKPNLGLVEYNGNKNNNMFAKWWGPVIKDPLEKDGAKRYKMLIKGPAGCPPDAGVRVASSPDGIHWNDGPRIDLPSWKGRFPDMVVFLCDEEDPDPQRRYKMVWQSGIPATKPGPEECRAKDIAFGPDPEHFVASPANPILSPNDGLEQEDHFLMLFPWRGWYVMPYEYASYIPEGTGNLGAYCGDVRLAISRDAEHYQRIQPHQKVIARGKRGEWDDRFIVISDKPVIKDGLIYLYYCGQGEDWTGWPGGNIPEGFSERYKFASTGSVRLSRMGLATLEVDRFTCVETTDRETPGAITSSAIMLDEKSLNLVLNLSETQQNRSWLEVEVLNTETGQTLEGFSREECVDVARDGQCVPVAWRKKQWVDLSGSSVKLRFHIYGAARLYTFGFD